MQGRLPLLARLLRSKWTLGVVILLTLGVVWLGLVALRSSATFALLR